MNNDTIEKLATWAQAVSQTLPVDLKRLRQPVRAEFKPSPEMQVSVARWQAIRRGEHGPEARRQLQDAVDQGLLSGKHPGWFNDASPAAKQEYSKRLAVQAATNQQTKEKQERISEGAAHRALVAKQHVEYLEHDNEQLRKQVRGLEDLIEEGGPGRGHKN